MFSVRKATKDDIDGILKITKEAFLNYIKIAGIEDTAALHETREQVEADIENKSVYVAYINDVIVGSLRLERINEDTAYLSRFAVSNEFQNRGIGKSIMSIFDEEMKQAGIKHVVLHTASQAFPLMRFYYGRGFYVHSTTRCKGYIRALMCKDYE